jgi:chromosomal replication initiator protein
MSSAVENQFFSVPLRHLRSVHLTNDQVLTESSVAGLNRYVGDEENGILRYLASDQPLLATDWPLVFLGASGTGKTALALSVVDRLIEESHGSLVSSENNSPPSPAIFSAPDFVRRFHSAIETNSVSDFRARIVGSAVLLIDNVHLLANNPGAQNELIYLLDELSEKDVPVVITLGTLLENSTLITHLSSRLSSGLSLELRTPGPHARAEIIRDLAGIHGLEIHDDAIPWLVERFKVTVPRLNHFLTQLKAEILSTRDDRQLDLAFFQSLFENVSNQSEWTKTIVRQVAAEFRIKTADLKSSSRKQSVVLARGVAIYLCRTLLNTSFNGIGNNFGNRDHSTVMHAYNKVLKLLETQPGSAIQKRILGLQDRLSKEFSSQTEFSLATENSSETGWNNDRNQPLSTSKS